MLSIGAMYGIPSSVKQGGEFMSLHPEKFVLSEIPRQSPYLTYLAPGKDIL